MKIISVTSLRSGSGASCISASLAWCLSNAIGSKKVLAVDAVPSKFGMSSLFSAGSDTASWADAVSKGEDPLTDAVLYDNMLLVLSLNNCISKPDVKTTEKLIHEIKELPLEYVIIDAGLYESSIEKSVASLSDSVTILVEPDTSETAMVDSLSLKPNEYILFCKVDNRSSVQKELMKIIRSSSVGNKVLDAEIPLDEFVREASINEKPYSQYLGFSEAGSQTDILSIELMRIIGGLKR